MNNPNTTKGNLLSRLFSKHDRQPPTDPASQAIIKNIRMTTAGLNNDPCSQVTEIILPPTVPVAQIMRDAAQSGMQYWICGGNQRQEFLVSPRGRRIPIVRAYIN